MIGAVAEKRLWHACPRSRRGVQILPIVGLRTHSEAQLWHARQIKREDGMDKLADRPSQVRQVNVRARVRHSPCHLTTRQ
jgi:hypothetical protein